MKKVLIFSLFIVFAFGFSSNAQAQTATSTSTNLAEIQRLLQQLQQLQQQLSELQRQQSSVRQEISSSLQLIRQLSVGMSGEDVRLLQEMLATDPEIYPEGLITGYFGSLTEKAVRKFQQKQGIDTAGRVGPQTLRRINELLTSGAGNSGKIPPGLLRAPGIAKKLGNAGTSTGTSTPDNTAPVLSNISASGSASTTLTVIWNTNELANGQVWLSTSTPVTANFFDSESSASFTLGHTFTFTGLNASTTYYYLVSSTDKSGNTATSTERTATTTGN